MLTRILVGFVLLDLQFMCMFCRSLFVLLCFFFWPLCCLFFFDIRILITTLVSSNSYCTSRKSIKHCVHWDVLSDPKIVVQQNQLNIHLCSLGYVDPKAQQNQLNIVFFEICSSEGGISSKSAKYCVHWDVVARKKCYIYT